MGYLLDTHTIIWFFENPEKIPKKIIDIIIDENNIIYICSISLLEIVIKLSIGKLRMNYSLDILIKFITNGGIKILHVDNNYLNELLILPFIHKDPFDRLIISTAITDNLTVITMDENIHRYNVSCIW